MAGHLLALCSKKGRVLSRDRIINDTLVLIDEENRGPMQHTDITRTLFTVADFVTWS